FWRGPSRSRRHSRTASRSAGGCGARADARAPGRQGVYSLTCGCRVLGAKRKYSARSAHPILTQDDPSRTSTGASLCAAATFFGNGRRATGAGEGWAKGNPYCQLGGGAVPNHYCVGNADERLGQRWYVI